MTPSASAPPTNKRRRPPSPIPSRTMHDNTFCFDDGSIVLAARGDLDHEHEATYVDTPTAPNNVEGGPANAKRGRLIGKAFALTTNADINDGVPLVIVHDKAKDIRGFLQVIYKPSSVFLPSYDPASAKLLTGPLLLAFKYQADNHKEWKVKTAALEAEAVGCGVHISHPVDLLQLIRTVNMPDYSLKKVRAVALHNMLGQPKETCYDVDPTALDARDCLAFAAGQARTNDWL
ncbi:hypothetical protein BDN71DRAFT_1502146 [Pleurotus eryngii]|uniref:Uncharacterized protein n=1 Tax=Pleurotus eryngii TaxID=5323 RepID=A0A9P6A9Z5_PLEER|nr:hypothetical protein BDN71DRAFT_1502146 [Pleurotus eryngii]